MHWTSLRWPQWRTETLLIKHSSLFTQTSCKRLSFLINIQTYSKWLFNHLFVLLVLRLLTNIFINQFFSLSYSYQTTRLLNSFSLAHWKQTSFSIDSTWNCINERTHLRILVDLLMFFWLVSVATFIDVLFCRFAKWLPHIKLR